MKRFLLACLLISPFSNALADQDSVDEPWVILQKAAEAARVLSYKGIFVSQAGSAVSTMQITHMNNEQGEFAQVVVLDGSSREVLSQGGEVVIYSPGNEKTVIEKRRGQHLFPALLPADMDVVKIGYQARVGNRERVAGRDVQVVFLDPRDRYRYGYKLWADREYGLLLKTMLLNERNEAIEQMAFNQLTLINTGINAETSTGTLNWFFPKANQPKHYAPADAVQTSSQEPDSWKIGRLPAGFRKIDHMKRQVPGKPGPVDHMIFSDGLASISVFIEPLAKGSRPKTGHVMVGTTNFCANFTDGYQIVAVGEVPEVTVTQVAKAISLKK